MNDGSHTYHRGTTNSCIDISLCSQSLINTLTWCIHTDTHGSDHNPIEIHACGLSPSTTRRRRWRYEDANWNDYELEIERRLEADREYTISEITQSILKAAEASIPRTSGKPGRRSVYWWNKEVEDAIKTRRKALRKLKKLSNESPLRDDALNMFRIARNHARKVMEESKKKSWEEFLDGISNQTSCTEMWLWVGNAVRVDSPWKLAAL